MKATLFRRPIFALTTALLVVSAYMLGFVNGKTFLAQRCLSINKDLFSYRDDDLLVLSLELASPDKAEERLLLTMIKSDMDIVAMYKALQRSGDIQMAYQLLMEKIRVDLDVADITQGPMEPASFEALNLLTEEGEVDELDKESIEKCLKNLGLQVVSAPRTFRSLGGSIRANHPDLLWPSMASLLCRCATFDGAYAEAADWARFGIAKLKLEIGESPEALKANSLDQRILSELQENLAVADFLERNPELTVERFLQNSD